MSQAWRTSSCVTTRATVRSRRSLRVWLSSVFLKTLRDYRVAILGWGIGMGLVVVSPMASVATLVTTQQAREQLISLASSFAWNADVVAVDTIGGYATWKIGIFIFLIAIWTLLVAMGMLIGLLAFGGGQKFGADFTLGDALFYGLNVALVCAVIGGLALLISQFTQEQGPAAGWTAGLLLIFIVMDMVHRVVANTEWISRLSPIYYYNLSKPFVPSYG